MTLCIVEVATRVARNDAPDPLDTITRIMAELSLDDDQRNAFVRHLDSVRVAKLMRCEAPPDSG